jgi:hypothetical protein
MRTPERVTRPPATERRLGTSPSQTQAIRNAIAGMRYRKLTATDADIREKM